MIEEAYRVTALIGRKGTGKTPFAIGDKDVPVPSFVANHCMKWNMKALFVDMQEHRNRYEKFKACDWKNIRDWRGAIRIIPKVDERAECVQWIVDNVRNTYIVFEDAGKLFPMQIRDTPQEALLIDCKNHECGIMMMYHDYMMVPRGAYSHINDLVIFKNGSHPSVRGKREIPNYMEVLKTHEAVMNHRNNYYHKTVEINP
jgi:hypothetical protein